MQYRLLILIIGLSSFFSCERQSNSSENSISEGELFIRNGLLNGHYQEIDRNKSLTVYENSLWLFSKEPEGFSKDDFVFDLSSNIDRISLDFDIEQTRLDPVSLGNFQNLEILFYEWGQGEYDQLTIGQISEDLPNTDTIWKAEVDLNRARNRPHPYDNELGNAIGINIRQSEFHRQLREGKFFRVAREFYVLITEDAFYLIRQDQMKITDKIMLHFIRENNEFDNKSFNFSKNQYQKYLLGPYQDLRIARVSFPQELANYPKIRIGQFNEEGNTWVQVMDTKEILSNELLHYQSEFNDLIND